MSEFEKQKLIDIAFWVQAKSEGSAPADICDANIKRISESTQVLPATTVSATPQTLMLADEKIQHADQIESLIKEWYGDASKGLKIDGEAWNVFLLKGSNAEQRAEVEQHQLTSNVNARLTKMFTASQGKSLSILDIPLTADEGTKDLNYIAKNAVLEYMANLAAITIAWWMDAANTHAGEQARAGHRIITKNAMIKDQNDHARITRLQGLFKKNVNKVETPKVADHLKTTFTTCGKKHLGTCLFDKNPRAAKKAVAPPAKATTPKKGLKTKEK